VLDNPVGSRAAVKTADDGAEEIRGVGVADAEVCETVEEGEERCVYGQLQHEEAEGDAVGGAAPESIAGLVRRFIERRKYRSTLMLRSCQPVALRALLRLNLALGRCVRAWPPAPSELPGRW